MEGSGVCRQMEAGTVLRSSATIHMPSNFRTQSTVCFGQRPDFISCGSKFRPSSANGWMKLGRFQSGLLDVSVARVKDQIQSLAGPTLEHIFPSISTSKQGQRHSVSGSRQSTCIRASINDADGSSSPAHSIAPLQLESPIGKFLSQILVSHPHLVPAAVEQQLQQLQTDREAEQQKDEPSTIGTELVLYRRIAEVKANERRKALEEILYALVVQKFVEAGVSLIPAMSQPSDPPGRVDSWPSQEQKLMQLHSPEAFEMIRNHLALILGNQVEDLSSVAQISKLRVGQVYAASVMYGYFLKRVDQRFQLEKSMKTLPFGSDGEESSVERAVHDELRPNGATHIENAHSENVSWSGGIRADGFGYGIKPTKLRSYVMSFDSETLQRYATIRSKEAVGIIEKHTEALFGRPEIVITSRGGINSSNDEVIRISFAGLQRLVLEAVTFGSFLWDVESFVDSRYHFVMN